MRTVIPGYPERPNVAAQLLECGTGGHCLAEGATGRAGAGIRHRGTSSGNGGRHRRPASKTVRTKMMMMMMMMMMMTMMMTMLPTTTDN